MTGELRPWPTLRQADQAQAVRDVQHLLRGNGYVLEAEGIFGPVTDATVRTFQKPPALAVDGVVGPDTWSELIIDMARSPVIRIGVDSRCTPACWRRPDFRCCSARLRGRWPA